MLKLINHTTALAEHYTGYDSERGATITCVVKAGWQYSPRGELFPLKQIEPIIVQDNYFGLANRSSIVQAQENINYKPHAEFILYGRCYPLHTNTCQHRATVAICFPDKRWQKSLLIHGERQWLRRAGEYVISAAKPLEAIPLRYEYAYGGNNAKSYFTANPAGVGYALEHHHNVDGYLPQIEYPDQAIQCVDDQPTPAGFGPLPLMWLQNKLNSPAQHSVIQHFSKTRASMAPLDQCFKQYFNGGETLELMGLHPQQAVVTCQLPKLVMRLVLRRNQHERFAKMVCDTMVVNTQQQTLHLIWRTHLSCDRKYDVGIIHMEQ